LLTIVPEGASITLHAGRRKLTLNPTDIEHYRGERGRRGNKLPRGLQRVDQIEIEAPKLVSDDASLDDSTVNENIESKDDSL
jgi:topoisomerase-4 subunit A